MTRRFYGGYVRSNACLTLIQCASHKAPRRIGSTVRGCFCHGRAVGHGAPIPIASRRRGCAYDHLQERNYLNCPQAQLEGTSLGLSCGGSIPLPRCRPERAARRTTQRPASVELGQSTVHLAAGSRRLTVTRLSHGLYTVSSGSHEKLQLRMNSDRSSSPYSSNSAPPL